jgi:hypothetical protein
MAKTCDRKECEELYVSGRPIRYCPYCGKPLDEPRVIDQI